MGRWGPIDRLFYSICLAKWRFDAAVSGGSVSDDGRDCYRWLDSDTSQSQLSVTKVSVNAERRSPSRISEPNQHHQV